MTYYAPSTGGEKSVDSINGRTTLYGPKVPDDDDNDDNDESTQIDREHDSGWEEVEDKLAKTSDKNDRKYFEEQRRERARERALGKGSLRKDS